MFPSATRRLPSNDPEIEISLSRRKLLNQASADSTTQRHHHDRTRLAPESPRLLFAKDLNVFPTRVVGQPASRILRGSGCRAARSRGCREQLSGPAREIIAGGRRGLPGGRLLTKRASRIERCAHLHRVKREGVLANVYI